MTATNYTLCVEQGATFSRQITWKDNAGALINNATYTARLQVRKEADLEPIISLTNSNGGIVLGGANGQITLSISATNTAALLPGDYFYDLELQSAGGIVTRMLAGIFSVQAEITK